MINVDPASPTFESLPRHEQAFILANACNWSIEDLMDEYGVSRQTVRLWIVPGAYEHRLEQRRNYRTTPEGLAKTRAQEAQRRLRDRAARPQRTADPDCRPLYEQDQLSIGQIADRIGLSPSRVRTVLRRQGVTFRSRQEGRALRIGNEKTRRSFTKKRVA